MSHFRPNGRSTRPTSSPHAVLGPSVLSVRHSKGRAFQGPSEPRVRASDHQHPGRRSRKVEAEVCVLDPRATHRRKRSRERPLGRADREHGPRRMAGYPGYYYQPVESFWSDTRPTFVTLNYDVPLYERPTHDALGADEQDDSDSNPSAARCFNCGSTDHILSRCSEPRNHKLIALTRQFYEFSRGGAPVQYRRIHEVAEWQKTRIKWLEQFVPGEIRGPELRNALGLSEGDVGQYTPWLKEMAEHGYPKGWIAPEDPRTRVWERLAVSQDVDDDEEPFEFWIHGDTDELVPESSTSTSGTGSSDDTHSVDTSDHEKGQVPGVPLLRRWARYPETFFSNDLLFAYQPPPPTRDEDPLEYLSEFLHLIMPPPPPDVSPPPLPPAPLPPNYPPPLLPMYPSYPTPSMPLLSNYLPPVPASYSTQSLVATKHTPHNTSDDTSDMDFSDSD
ncbi:hypothetical protein PHLGIDRAFT_127398 [Phlebiopsis gigantea 11061_1 CR5-6]|uniref:PSP proline-rich domain-containing protein n=1 Tax=Phlebiopsis gigantea (strain 11061_1 CR5-6) TaxID=745531 RepID=A0A0C3NRJ8_PHLG1|nr:hypothetical protein PHLGIDRAFT_127398 [Phlebiopsis gigantea 11061_1 CR5-6]